MVAFMLIDRSFKHLTERLNEGVPLQISYHGGAEITIRFACHLSKIALTTPVFDGGSFIPYSVRECVSKKSPFGSQQFRTFLTVDEPGYQVKLNYLGHLEDLKQEELNHLMQEFDRIAEKWRELLDEKGRGDLIHVRVK